MFGIKGQSCKYISMVGAGSIKVIDNYILYFKWMVYKKKRHV